MLLAGFIFTSTFLQAEGRRCFVLDQRNKIINN